MASFNELHPKVRKAKVKDAVDGILRQLDAPAPTSEIVQRAVVFLGVTRDEQNLLARDIVKLAAEHPMSRLTGETFVKYGKTMNRREWLPSHAQPAPNAPIRLSDGERARRRAKIAQQEAEDEWSIPAPAEFLEDE